MAATTAGRVVVAVAHRGVVSEEGENFAAGPRIAAPGHDDPVQRGGGNRHVVYGDVAAAITATEEATPAEAATAFVWIR